MSDCDSIRPMLPLSAGGDLNPTVSRRVKAHVSICAACGREEAQYSMVIATGRATCPGGHSLPDSLRSRIALEAAVRVSRASWIARLLSIVPVQRPVLAGALAAALVAIVAAPLAWRGGHVLRHEHQDITTIEVVQSDGVVTLAWSDGSKASYTVYKSSDPRQFSSRQAHVVKGNIWRDDDPGSSPVVYYRVE